MQPNLKSTIPLVRVISGPSRGQDFILDSNEVIIDKRISIIKRGNRFLLKSLTFSEVMINGEAFMEAILEKYDKIITETSEYIFIAEDSIATAKKKMFILAGSITLIAILGLMLIPTILSSVKNSKPAQSEASKIKLKESQSKPISSVVYDATAMAEFAIQDLKAAQSQNELKTPSNEEEYDMVLAQARLRSQIAQAYANDPSQGLGNLFWAIQQWKTIVETFKDFNTPPAIVSEAIENINKYQQLLDSRKEHYILLAKLAGARGDTKSQMDALDALLNLLQVESGPNAKVFSNAQLQLLEITQSLQQKTLNREVQ